VRSRAWNASRRQSRKPFSLLRGTEGSNPSPSSRESDELPIRRLLDPGHQARVRQRIVSPFEAHAAFDVDALEDVLLRVRKAGLLLGDIRAEHCRHPALDGALERVFDDIQEGRGIVIVRGLPVDGSNRCLRTKLAPLARRSKKSGSQVTRRWREVDSNLRSPSAATLLSDR
jgi:hypothetical protein